MPPASAPESPGLAIILAGGSGRRLGLVDKPALVVAGRTLLSTALAAVAPAVTVVVGPVRDLPPGVIQTRERPPHGGPAAGLAAGLAVLSSLSAPAIVFDADQLLVVLAADLPGINGEAISLLTAAVRKQHVDGAVLVDPDGHDQYLAGVWRARAVQGAAASRPSWHGARLSDLLGPLVGARVPADRATAADIDTTVDLREWAGAEHDLPPNPAGVDG